MKKTETKEKIYCLTCKANLTYAEKCWCGNNKIYCIPCYTNNLIIKHAKLFALNQLFSSYPTFLTYDQIIDIYENNCEEIINEMLKEIDEFETLSIRERYQGEWHESVKYILQELKDNFYYRVKYMLKEFETI